MDYPIYIYIASQNICDIKAALCGKNTQLIQILQQDSGAGSRKTAPPGGKMPHHLEGLLKQGPLTFLISKSLMVQSSRGMSEADVTLMFSKRLVP